MNRDAYQTPREVFAVLNAEFDFKLDAAASESNSLVPGFYMDEVERNCLTADWFAAAGMENLTGWYSWLNPPCSDIGPFVKRAAEMAVKGVGTVMLVMMDQSVGWYKEAIKTCQEVRLVIGGRLSFIDPSTGKPAAGNNKGSMFLIWHPFGRTKVQYSHIERDELLAAGRELLNQSEQQRGMVAELSTNALQLPDHIVDANKMVGAHINEGASVCVSETEDQAEQIATKCVEESGTDIDGGTKADEVVAAVQPEATETTEEQTDLFEHFDEAMVAGTEPVPEPEAEPEPAVITSKNGKVKSDDAEVFFDQLQIPQNVRAISAKCPDTGISRSGYAIWAKGYFSAGKINGIGIRTTGDFKKGYFYEPTLVVFHQGKDVGEYTNWPEALAALDALLQPDPDAEPEGAAHPFFTGFYGGHATYAQTVPDKVAKVKTFTLEQCQAALKLKLPHLQSTVLAAVEARIRKLQKEQAA